MDGQRYRSLGLGASLIWLQALIGPPLAACESTLSSQAKDRTGPGQFLVQSRQGTSSATMLCLALPIAPVRWGDARPGAEGAGESAGIGVDESVSLAEFHHVMRVHALAAHDYLMAGS
jgi:hypothetical protein